MSDPATFINTTAGLLVATSSLLDAVVSFLPKVVMLSAMFCAFVPPPVPGKSPGFMTKLFSGLNALAFNFRHSANRDQVGPLPGEWDDVDRRNPETERRADPSRQPPL